MPDKKNRQRTTQLHFYVNDKELELIKQKMALYGTENMSAYLRKLAIDGYILRLELPELVSLMRRISNSENQIAKKLNASDRIYDDRNHACSKKLHITVLRRSAFGEP
ncbi:MAG: plasmid mobilization relaxosome protein MobC [Acutalibacteraceae bacterium]